ncbi:hypothetical protein EOPP23_14190, partial [Endozoicomonas sp. OPT23]|uniref:Ig-like domain-containing protein n=1 Tax=Endozoicomonas sp. OPT23 TaxID=2072845 RepID=UPI0018913C2B
VATTDDTLDENNETVDLSIGGETATGTIVDNDHSPIANHDPESDISGGLRGSYYEYNDTNNPNLTTLAQILAHINSTNPQARFVSSEINYGYTDDGNGKYDQGESVGSGDLADTVGNDNIPSNLRKFLNQNSDTVNGDGNTLVAVNGGATNEATDGIILLTGTLNVQVAGTYKLNVAHDDGFAVYIDGQEVLAFDGITGPKQTGPVSISLTEGDHSVVVVYWDQGGEHLLDLQLNDSNETNIWVPENLSHSSSDPIVTSEDQAITFSVTDNDTDEDGNLDETSVVIVTDPSKGQVNVDPVTGKVTYTPNPDQFGQDTFTYTVKDTSGNISNVATVTVTVLPVNDDPALIAGSITFDEDVVTGGHSVGSGVSNLLSNVNDIDDDNSIIKVGMFKATENGTAVRADGSNQLLVTMSYIDKNGDLQTLESKLLVKSDGSYIFGSSASSADDINVLPEGVVATGSFWYTVIDDSTGESDFVQAKIRINGENDDPVATSDVNSVEEGASLTVDAENGVILGGTPDSDIDGGDLVVSNISSGSVSKAVPSGDTGDQIQGAYGTLTIYSDGSYSYTATANAVPSGLVVVDTFTYTVNDGRGGLDTAELRITVNGIEINAPTVELAEDTGLQDLQSTNPGLNISSEEGTTVLFSLDGGNTWTSSYDPVHGANTILVKAVDSAGNESVSSDPLTFTYLAPNQNRMITAGNVSSTHLGFQVTALAISDLVSSDPRKGVLVDGDVIVNGSPSGFGVRGNTANDSKGTAEIGYHHATGLSEQLIVNFDNHIQQATVKLAWLGGSEDAEYTLYLDGQEVGKGRTTANAKDEEINITGKVFDRIIFSAPGDPEDTDNDYLIQKITYVEVDKPHNVMGDINNNILVGSKDEDLIEGKAGSDTLIGGKGNDQLNGGDGSDRFVFNLNDLIDGATVQIDRITDFKVGNISDDLDADRIDLSELLISSDLSDIESFISAAKSEGLNVSFENPAETVITFDGSLPAQSNLQSLKIVLEGHAQGSWDDRGDGIVSADDVLHQLISNGQLIV